MATINVLSNKNITELTYTTADTILIRNGAVLTVDSTPAVQPLSIQCLTSGKLRVVNTSTSAPIKLELSSETGDYIFRGNGVFEVRGDMIEIGAGNGAQQSWDFATLFGGQLQHIGYVEVETAVGSGEYLPWPILESNPLLTTNYGGLLSDMTTQGSCAPATVDIVGEAGDVFFWDFLTRELKTGDGVNYGKTIPTGRKIRIPNIYIGNRYKMYSSTNVTLATVGTPTGGTFKLDVRNGLTGALIGTTVNIAYNAAAATVDTAIGTVVGSASNVTCSGGALPTAIRIYGAGTYANVPLMITINTSALTGGTTPKVYTTLYNVDDVTLINLTPSGTFDGECCYFSPLVRWEVSAFSAIRMKKVGVGGHNGFYASSSNGSIDLENMYSATNPYAIQEVSSINSVLGEIKMKGCTWLNPIGQAAYTLSILPGMSLFKDNKFYSSGYGTSTSRYLLTATSLGKGLIFDGNMYLGGEVNIVSCSDIQLLNNKITDSIYKTQRTTYGTYGIYLTNVIGCLIYNLSLGGTTVCRTNIATADAQSADIKIMNTNIDCKNHATGLIYTNNNSTVLENCNVTNIRSTGMVQQAGTYLALGLKAKKLVGTFATAHTGSALPAGQNFEYDGVAVSEFGFTQAHSGVERYVGGSFLDEGVAPTKGHITFGAFGANGALELIGGTYTDQLGKVFLPSAGDSFVATMPNIFHGITGFDTTQYQYRIAAEVEGGTSTVNVLICPEGSDAGSVDIGIYNASGVLVETVTVSHADSTTTIDTKFTTNGGSTTVTGAWTTGYTITSTNYIACKVLNNTCTIGGQASGVSIAATMAITTAAPTTHTINYALDRLNIEYSIRRPDGVWSAYTSPSDIATIGTALNTLLGTISGYTPEEGFQIRMRVTTLTDNLLQSINQISVKTTVDLSKILTYNASVNIQGAMPTDTISVKRISDNVELYSFTGSGLKEFDVGSNYGTVVRYERYNSSGFGVASTILTPLTIRFGLNDEVNLFVGNEVQLAQSAEVTQVMELVNTMLANSEVINRNVQKASLLVPATENL